MNGRSKSVSRYFVNNKLFNFVFVQNIAGMNPPVNANISKPDYVALRRAWNHSRNYVLILSEILRWIRKRGNSDCETCRIARNETRPETSAMDRLWSYIFQIFLCRLKWFVMFIRSILIITVTRSPTPKWNSIQRTDPNTITILRRLRRHWRQSLNNPVSCVQRLCSIFSTSPIREIW